MRHSSPSLHYFTTLLREVEELKVSPDYWSYLSHKVDRLEQRWRRESAAVRKEGVSAARLEQQALRMSDTECALRMQQRKRKLLDACRVRR